MSIHLEGIEGSRVQKGETMSKRDLERRRSYRRQQDFTFVSEPHFGRHVHDLHVASNSRITIDPPGSANARLALKDAKLIETKHFFQTTAHCNSRGTSTNNEDGIVAEGTTLVIIDDSNGIGGDFHVGCLGPDT